MTKRVNTDSTEFKNYDDEIRLLDIKHREKMASLQEAMEQMTETYIEERAKLVETKTRETILGKADSDYLTAFIDIEQAGKFINRSTGWIYRNVYDCDKQEVNNDNLVPAHRKGNRWFFLRKELQDWMMMGCSRSLSVEEKAKEYINSHPKH